MPTRDPLWPAGWKVPVTATSLTCGCPTLAYHVIFAPCDSDNAGNSASESQPSSESFPEATIVPEDAPCAPSVNPIVSGRTIKHARSIISISDDCDSMSDADSDELEWLGRSPPKKLKFGHLIGSDVVIRRVDVVNEDDIMAEISDEMSEISECDRVCGAPRNDGGL